MTAVVPQLQKWPRGPFNELHRAARYGPAERVLAVLLKGMIDVNQGTPDGLTPHMHGATQGSPRIIQILLNRGADASVVTDEGVTALHLSSQHGHLSATNLLAKSGADLEATMYQGYTSLHEAAAEGHSEVIEALIEAGANPNPRLPGDGQTPLYLAAWKGHVDAVRVLFRANANPLLLRTVVLDMGYSPLDAATIEGHADVAREVVRQLGAEGSLGESALGVGCSPKIARLLVDGGVNTEARVRVVYSSDGNTYETTILALTNRRLREKKLRAEDATEEQLNGLEGIRRLLLRVEAVHAVS